MCKEVYNIIRRNFDYFRKTIFKEKFLLEENISAKGLEAHYYKKRILRILSAVLALASAVIFSFALIKDFEPQSQLFKHGSFLFTAAFAFTFASCAITFALCFILIPKATAFEPIFPKENEHKAYYSSDEIETRIVRILTALGLLALSAVRLHLLFSGKVTVLSNLPLTMLSVFLAFPFALYFVPEITDRLFSSPKAHLVCGFFGVAWCICNVIEKYFDHTYVLSSPYRLTEQLLILLLMLFTVYEIKMHTEERSPRLHLAFLCSTFIFCFGFTVARCAMLVCEKTVSTENTAIIVFEFAFTLYLAIRLYHYNED